jgi:hypothetical protein
MREGCRASLGWAGGTTFDFAQDRLCPYVFRGKENQAAIIYRGLRGRVARDHTIQSIQ